MPDRRARRKGVVWGNSGVNGVVLVQYCIENDRTNGVTEQMGSFWYTRYTRTGQMGSFWYTRYTRRKWGHSVLVYAIYQTDKWGHSGIRDIPECPHFPGQNAPIFRARMPPIFRRPHFPGRAALGKSWTWAGLGRKLPLELTWGSLGCFSRWAALRISARPRILPPAPFPLEPRASRCRDPFAGPAVGS